jgi:hypothetical protein
MAGLLSTIHAARFWEDFYDTLLAGSRAREPPISEATFEAGLISKTRSRKVFLVSPCLCG